ncbi:ABC transporter A family member 8-like [Lolium rigidum]|uniref:ABC transporter A family member 8-like n=1 Tax=Lolium rigidum TaxID=89674 RepID=UPI001F5C59D3|nr:ABC transporter A family member 8-like [Lolium rigidum]
MEASAAAAASRPPSFATQTNALLRKNLIFQKRNGKATIRLILIPIFLCLLLSVLQRVINNLLDQPRFRCGCKCVDANGTGACQNVCGIQYSTVDQARSCPIQNPTEWPALLQLPRPEYRAVHDPSSVFTGLPDASCRKSESCPAIVPFTGANETVSNAIMKNLFTSSTLSNLSHLASVSNLLLGTDVRGASTGFIEPAFVSDQPIYVIRPQCKSSDSDILITVDATDDQKEIKCVQGLPLWRNSSTTINEETFQGYRKGKKGEGIYEITMGYDFQESNEKFLNVLALYNSSYQNNSFIPTLPFGLRRVSRSLNVVSNAYLQFLLGPGAEMLLKFIKEMPKHSTRQGFEFSTAVGPLFFEWVVALLFPVMLTYLVYEKQHKLRTMMKMHGLGDGPYWIINYSYFLILSTLYLVMFVLFGSLIGLNFFKMNDYSIQFVFFFSFINLQIVLSFLAATLFTKVNTAQAIAYVYIFGSGFMAGALIHNFIEGEFPRHWITVLEIIPAFSLYRGLYELGQYAIRASATGYPGMRWGDLNDRNNGMKDVLIIIVLEWLVLLPIAYYFDHASSAGHKSSPLSMIKCVLNKKATSRRINANAIVNEDIHVELEMIDIIKEREVVDQILQQRSSGYAIVCDDLKKLYHGKDGNPDKFAVRGVSLALPYGECLGILGPNGAGKSSFISMMIGLTKPTSGNAFVEDFNIQTDMENIYNNMGVCPQNDMLWEMLTGREHLQFYGRLKNLNGSSLDLAVEESLRSVNLLHGGAPDKQVRTYSGGMQRRLSVAISLIGDAKVVYMDEPSTGLDPASRKSLWCAVKQAKQDRAIILTTHSMEEAEVLCDRLCIMVDGRLQCIGSPKELIARYGGYYVLTITTSSEFERVVQKLVLELSPRARKVYHLSGTQKHELPKQEVRIADVFRAMENLKKKAEVQAWGLADTTMEDVFVKVATARRSSDELS